jgi:hypothetical protein
VQGWKSVQTDWLTLLPIGARKGRRPQKPSDLVLDPVAALQRQVVLFYRNVTHTKSGQTDKVLTVHGKKPDTC